MNRVLILGASGMLGNALLRSFVLDPKFVVLGTVRSAGAVQLFPQAVRQALRPGVNVDDFDTVIDVFGEFRPTIVVNAVGVVKQLSVADDPLYSVPLNSLLPHRLARLCSATGARFVHISTDCVFNGKTGGYTEESTPDAVDLYGRSKLLGEVDYPNAVTLRTSIIGHELSTTHGLVEWFLTQERVRGFARAIFSGLPTVELARVIADFVLPFPELRGVYHVASDPISKLDLLRIVASAYGCNTEIVADDHLVLDRSLNSARFRRATGYVAPPWPELVAAMRNFG